MTGAARARSSVGRRILRPPFGGGSPLCWRQVSSLAGEWVENFAKPNPPLGAQAPKFREVRPAPVQAAACLDGAAVVFIFLGVAGVLAVVVDVVFLGVDVVEVLRRHAENLRK